jgi:uncharacterized membrane protein YvlD (DUF360 family)
MKFLTAFIMKWIALAVVLLIVYSAVYEAPVGTVLLMSIIFTAVSYLGDVFILPRVRNTTETIMDLVFSFLALWALGALMLGSEVPIITAAIISSIVIAVGEWFLHSYMKRNIFHQEGPTQA